jgi:anti-anti-sigma regulatory factor
METESLEELVMLRPQGRVNVQNAGDLLSALRQAQGGFELDLSAVESFDVSALQVILSAVATARRREKPVVVKDSEAGVLRSTLVLAGIDPIQAGLSVRFVL